MHSLYVPGSALWERFKDPLDYLETRRQTERWLRQAFIAKGGRPVNEYPIYFVVGSPKWIERVGDPVTLSNTAEIRVPLDIFEEYELSFTYPDSMVTFWLESQKDPAWYQPDYHGKVFTRSEITGILAQKGFPDEGWSTDVPDTWAHYIEAQAWNSQPLMDWLQVTGGLEIVL